MLSPLYLGAFVVVAQHVAGKLDCFDEERARIARDDALVVLAMRGMASADAQVAISALEMAGLVQRANEGQDILLPAFRDAMRAQARELANRSAGWTKRKAGRGESQLRVVSADAAGSPPAVAAAPALAVQQSEAAAPDAPAAQRSASSGRVSTVARREKPAAMNRRFGPVPSVDPAENDPTVVRILTECKGTAELTRGLVDSLQVVFPDVDVEGQLRIAAQWCLDYPTRRKTMTGMRGFLTRWLNNATREAQIRGAVVRIARSKNGFGQGGELENRAKEAVPTGKGGDFGLSEFDLLEAAGADRVQPALQRVVPTAAPSPATGPSVGIRRSNAVRAGVQVPDAGRQRRLSDGLGAQ